MKGITYPAVWGSCKFCQLWCRKIRMNRLTSGRITVSAIAANKAEAGVEKQTRDAVYVVALYVVVARLEDDNVHKMLRKLGASVF